MTVSVHTLKKHLAQNKRLALSALLGSVSRGIEILRLNQLQVFACEFHRFSKQQKCKHKHTFEIHIKLHTHRSHNCFASVHVFVVRRLFDGSVRHRRPCSRRLMKEARLATWSNDLIPHLCESPFVFPLSLFSNQIESSLIRTGSLRFIFQNLAHPFRQPPS